jgi:hypothetical protein
MAVDHRLSQFFSGILARPGGSDRALGVADSSERARRQFTRWMFEDYPRAAPLTPYRWRRGMASGEGAFRAAWPPVGREDPGSTIFPVHD